MQTSASVGPGEYKLVPGVGKQVDSRYPTAARVRSRSNTMEREERVCSDLTNTDTPPLRQRRAR